MLPGRARKSGEKFFVNGPALLTLQTFIGSGNELLSFNRNRPVFPNIRRPSTIILITIYMKRKFYFLAMAALSVLLLTACPGPGPGPEPDPDQPDTVPGTTVSGPWAERYNVANGILGMTQDDVTALLSARGFDFIDMLGVYYKSVDDSVAGIQTTETYMITYGTGGRAMFVIYENIYQTLSSSLPEEYSFRATSPLVRAMASEVELTTHEKLPFQKLMNYVDTTIATDVEMVPYILDRYDELSSGKYAVVWKNGAVQMTDDIYSMQTQARQGNLTVAIYCQDNVITATESYADISMTFASKEYAK